MTATPTVLIMAAGRGKRMRSRTPKVLHPLCGRPLVLWPVEAARSARAERVIVVLGPEADEVRAVLPDEVEVVVQDPPAGTGDAVLAARAQLDSAHDVIVLSGDHPLLDASFITTLAQHHAETGATATVTTRRLDDPQSYGRIVRNGDEVAQIIETKNPDDATPEQLAIKEVNAGTYAFAVGPLLSALERVTPENSQGEVFLGDALPLIGEDGGKVVAYLTDDEAVGLGINTRADLARVQEVAQRALLERHMLAGVTIASPATTTIDAGVEIGADTTIEPASHLRGETKIGSGCTIGPSTTLLDTTVDEGSSVVHSHLDSCDVLAGCKVGPFAHIRPGTKLGAGAKAGAFTELKNAEIGEGGKVPHLSYIGDAQLGPQSNIGAGAITANYDGKRKHRTVIGAGARIGVNTSLVAPVHVGDNAYTGAGSVISEDVPDGALGISRPPQRNVEGYAERKDSDGG
jgi:bifunctional UDP-N-acetylglucosamine pyrophosphorylase/glucosamine-1-phosphate N-acetyltransferase